MLKDNNLLLLKDTINTLKRALLSDSNNYDPWVDNLLNIMEKIGFVLSKNSFCNENEENRDEEFKSRILNILYNSKNYIEKIELENEYADICIKKVFKNIKYNLNCIEIIIEMYENNRL